MSEDRPLPPLATLAVDGRVVATYVDGAALPAELSPRPFLHPVVTAAGTVVTDARPADHPWHLGVGVAVQDVAGANLWGGRTYVRGRGYVWRDDHGGQRHAGLVRPDGAGFTAEVGWHDRDGRPLLRETREARATAAGGAWLLDLAFTLVNDGPADVALGSPATNGRPGGGYGGFFWRLPALAGPRVTTADAEGEEAVHGSVSPWLALTGLVGGRPVTLLATQPAPRPVTQPVTPPDGVPPDPWFVRLAAYPGFGASLAAEHPVPVPAGGRIARRLRVLVADGAPVEELLPLLLAPSPDAR